MRRQRAKPEPKPILVDWLFECLKLVDLPVETEDEVKRLSEKWYSGGRLASHDVERLQIWYEDYT